MGHGAIPSHPTPNSHGWCPRRAGDSRSPCPALNTLANHGYLPRNGRGITMSKLICAIREAYHLTWPLAIFLVVGGYSLIRTLWGIDLEAFALHNGVEHNASLVHDDAPPDQNPSFAPTTVNLSLLKHLLDESADGRSITAIDIARARVRREARYEPGAIDAVHQEIARGEFALVLAIFGASRAIPVEQLSSWMQEERFPDKWERPKERITLIQIVMLSRDIRKAMAAMRRRTLD